jgi:two-component system phosphate regulon sensor histidine kinase PhoR
MNRGYILQYGFTAELRRLISFGFLCLTIGLIIDQLMATLVLFGVLYMGWTLANIYRLDHWLTQRKKTSIPDASGIWGDIFYNLSYGEKRAQRQQQRLKAVVNRIEATTAALNDGVILLNKHDCINWWNQAAGQLLAFKPIDKGSSILNYIRHPQFALYLNANDHDLPLDLPSHHRPEKQLQYQITRFGEGEGLLTVRDITRIHKLEEMRKDFVANVSHELRTPLTVIRGYLETFTDVNNIDPVWQKAISQMLQQANHMTELIDDLTILSKLETDNIENTQIPLELMPLLTTVIDVAKTFSNGSHTFSINGAQNIWIVGNGKELHSAFSNLLLNAVSYSPANNSTPIKTTAITVTVDKINRLSLSFTDNGLGIAPQHLSRLTERFYRVDSSRGTSTGGTGLGLAIVKHVLLRHEASLDITSELGQGSTFTCIFPSHKLPTTTDCEQAHLLD